MKLLLLNSGYLSGLNGHPLKYATHSWRYLLHSSKAKKILIALIKEVSPDIIALTETTPKQIKNLTNSSGSSKSYISISKNKYHPKSLMPLLPGFRYRHNAILTHSPVGYAFSYLKNGLHSLVIRAQITPHLAFFLVHLALKKSVRTKQIAELENILKKETGEVMIGGDFNTFDGASEIETLINKCNLKNANANHLPTFPAYNPKKELDYLLVSHNIAIKKIQVLDSQISDHRPLYISTTLNHEP